MKIIQKLNRGAIVTAVIVLGVIVYLTSMNINNKSQIPEIKKLSEQYLQAEIKYNMLPEKFRTIPPTITKEELNNHIANMKKELAEFYPKDYKNWTVESLEKNLKKQANGESVVYAYSKESRVKKIKFDDNTATVILVSNTTFDGQSIQTGKHDKSVFSVEDIIELTRINNKWYVTYSLINSQDNSKVGEGYEPFIAN